MLASTLGLAAAGVGGYFLTRELMLSPNAGSSAIANSNISPINPAFSLLPSQSLSPTTIELMAKSVSELPTSVTEPPPTTPDWYKALTSTAQPSSDSLQPLTHDSSTSLPALPSQSITMAMAPDSQLPTERPTPSTITPSTVMNNHQKSTVATPEKKAVEPIVERPYAEFEPAGYLAFSDTDFIGRAYGESRAIKRKIARNLPQDVHLIAYTSGNPERTREIFQPALNDTTRLHILKVSGNSVTRYWARDGLPIPVYGENGSLVLVDAKYYKRFEPDQAVANFFNATLLSHPYLFEGGNLLADSKGNCFTVNNKLMLKQSGFNDAVFRKYYGCKRLTRLRNKTKVGHVDEVIKIIDDQNIITDRPPYRPILRRLGYKVTMMPRAKGRHASYLNSVIINGKVFVPVYGDKKADKRAMDIYRSFGLRAYKFRSNTLSHSLMGSIHCSMVTYPKIGNNKPETSGMS
ncbi:agmatine deiminase family protein [Endozoicomonas sp. SCSIO W0465]|uniref:agmatine deiminase family protein n=1 Tax=Endozoicomonas sp. SCSIO W0465 TaxID=2918516 RepID=UPI002074EE71|nr:agmatine deiminase family protein [Endozoicomonas sp. SCSIO W0465]USE38195.1 agmatine deiminase family protein [Endozoicomonas sp. SCSIO W0465]